MPLILCLDTSTQICSVSLASGTDILGGLESHDEKSHSRQLGLFIRDLLSEHDLRVQQLDAVAVSKGPGSYTGLRIGVSTAKGIAYGSDIPLIGIGTLDALSSAVLLKTEIIDMVRKDPGLLLCPMLDARRMEVYTATYNSSGEVIENVSARIIDQNSYQTELEKGRILFFGNGSGKCMETISHPNAVFIENIHTSAANMVPLAERSFINKRFEDVAYFEPFYLKDFVATIPKNNIIPQAEETIIRPKKTPGTQAGPGMQE